MKRIVFIILLLLVPTLAFASPSIVFVKEAFDLGKVKQGEKVTQIFELKNAGDSELVIGKIAPS